MVVKLLIYRKIRKDIYCNKLQLCNMIFTNILHIAICNKQCFIALQFICNKPVIYWTMSDVDLKLA